MLNVVKQNLSNNYKVSFELCFCIGKFMQEKLSRGWGFVTKHLLAPASARLVWLVHAKVAQENFNLIRTKGYKRSVMLIGLAYAVKC